MSALPEVRSASDSAFRLDRNLDVATMSVRYRDRHRIRIPDVLQSTGALHMYKHLAREIDWLTFLASSRDLYHLSASELNDPTSQEERQVRLREGLRAGFASLYEANSLFPGESPQGPWKKNPPHTSMLQQFHEFVNGTDFQELCRRVTGMAQIARAEIQATRYRRGQFTGFHQAVPYCLPRGERLVGFELNLTIEWRPEWGGALEFALAEDSMTESFTPSFNVIDLYSARTLRGIHVVAPFAEGERLSVSGWLYADGSESAHEHA